MPGNPLAMAGPLRTVMVDAADLELQVDRLRRRDECLQQEASEHVNQVLRLCEGGSPPQGALDPLQAIAASCRARGALLDDLIAPLDHGQPFDQVATIDLRPIAENTFRWQMMTVRDKQRRSGARPGRTADRLVPRSIVSHSRQPDLQRTAVIRSGPKRDSGQLVSACQPRGLRTAVHRQRAGRFWPARGRRDGVLLPRRLEPYGEPGWRTRGGEAPGGAILWDSFGRPRGRPGLPRHRDPAAV